MHPAWMQNDEPPRREMPTSRPVAAPAPPRDTLLRSLFGMSPPNEVRPLNRDSLVLVHETVLLNPHILQS